MMIHEFSARRQVFTPPGDEASEVVSHCLDQRQLWLSNLSKVAYALARGIFKLVTPGYKAQNLPLHHCVPDTKKTLDQTPEKTLYLTLNKKLHQYNIEPESTKQYLILNTITICTVLGTKTFN